MNGSYVNINMCSNDMSIPISYCCVAPPNGACVGTNPACP
jgi:hypothetical protein